jgi:hypothetical protein
MDPGETIKIAAEREVLEETGIKTEFQGILGMREMLDFRYSASDIYIVCLMHCTCAEDQEINIIDKREVIEAKWIPLVDLSSNEEGKAKYRMFSNAYKFVQSVYARFMQNKDNTSIQGMCDPCISGQKSATEIMKQVSMTVEEVKPSTGKGKPWSYYISEPLKCSSASFYKSKPEDP